MRGKITAYILNMKEELHYSNSFFFQSETTVVRSEDTLYRHYYCSQHEEGCLLEYVWYENDYIILV